MTQPDQHAEGAAVCLDKVWQSTRSDAILQFHSFPQVLRAEVCAGLRGGEPPQENAIAAHEVTATPHADIGSTHLTSLLHQPLFALLG